MTDEYLRKVGVAISCIWGGEFIDYVATPSGYDFVCIEHGEEFVSHLETKDISKFMEECY